MAARPGRRAGSSRGVKTFEAELGRIPDVLAVRSIADDEERREVHVLAAPGRSAFDIAGDVESLAVLRGVELATDGIHVVQLEPIPDHGSSDADDSPLEEPGASTERRVAVDGVLVFGGEGTSRAVVTLRIGEQVATGTAVFVPAGSAARRGVAEATLAAVLELVGARAEMAVDSALVLQVPPQEVALVTIAAVHGSVDETLVGAVQVRSTGANEALARAVLDATNRWFGRHGRPSG